MAASAPSQAWPRRPSVAGVSHSSRAPAVANGRVPTTRARAFDALREIPGDALRSWTFEERRANLAAALDEGNGLVIVRGLHDLTPAELVDISRCVGPDVERNPGVDPRYLVPDWPEVQVIGNVRDDAGELRAMFSRAPPLPLDERGRPTLRYDPESRSPVWHTDQAFRDPPPFASLLYCVVAPPPSAGGHTPSPTAQPRTRASPRRPARPSLISARCVLTPTTTPRCDFEPRPIRCSPRSNGEASPGVSTRRQGRPPHGQAKPLRVQLGGVRGGSRGDRPG